MFSKCFDTILSQHSNQVSVVLSKTLAQKSAYTKKCGCNRDHSSPTQLDPVVVTLKEFWCRFGHFTQQDKMWNTNDFLVYRPPFWKDTFCEDRKSSTFLFATTDHSVQLNNKCLPKLCLIGGYCGKQTHIKVSFCSVFLWKVKSCSVFSSAETIFLLE